MAADGLSHKDVNLGAGCMILFLLPFAAVGAVTAVLAVQRLSARNWTEALFFALFAITFGGVGFGGTAAAVAGRRKLKEQAALQARHPDAPWLWRTDWASGRERTMPASEIADVTGSIGMQAGSTVYYDIIVVRKNGKQIKVGHSIRDKREAEWLAGTIKQAISS